MKRFRCQNIILLVYAGRMVPIREKKSPAEDFPAFAAGLYSRPAVAETVLHWQDRHGADVNLLLFACWHALFRGHMPDALLTQALQLSRQWQHRVIQPLRQCRRDMKHWPRDSGIRKTPGHEALREQIKAAELAAETELETALQSLCECPVRAVHGTSGPGMVMTNLVRYCQAAGLHADPEGLRPLTEQSLQWFDAHRRDNDHSV